jgi:DNA polymerase V
MRQHFGVVMERIVNELRGISCIPLEEMPSPKKQIMTSRSFGTRLTGYDDLRAAATHFATREAEKLRGQHLVTQALTVFIETSRFDTQVQYANSATIAFDLPTSDSAQLVHASNSGLRRIFKAGYSYQRAGILLPDLLPSGIAQLSLFETDCSERSEQLMVTVDHINKKHGKNAICYGSELVSNRWHMRQQFKSPSYTTKWGELLTIQI